MADVGLVDESATSGDDSAREGNEEVRTLCIAPSTDLY